MSIFLGAVYSVFGRDYTIADCFSYRITFHPGLQNVRLFTLLRHVSDCFSYHLQSGVIFAPWSILDCCGVVYTAPPIRYENRNALHEYGIVIGALIYPTFEKYD